MAVEDDVWPDGTRIKKGSWATYSPYIMGKEDKMVATSCCWQFSKLLSPCLLQDVERSCGEKMLVSFAQNDGWTITSTHLPSSLWYFRQGRGRVWARCVSGSHLAGFLLVHVA